MSNSFDYDIGIIGGGAAGLTVAAGAAQLGVKTLLVEKEPHLGGDCLHYGCVPSKTLINTAAVFHKMRKADQYGLPLVDLPPVDFTKVAERVQSVVNAIQEHDSEDRFCGLGVKVEFGQVSFVDEHQVEFDGRRVSAAKWVLSTGSSPVGLPLPGLEKTGYWTNEDLFSLDTLPESLIVVGGGPVGCEMAQAFARLGSRVRILHRSCHILSREDEDMAAVVQSALEAEGVRLDLCAATREVRRTKNGVEIEYEANGMEHTIKGDHILLAVGRGPNVSNLRLENAGVEYDKRGVKVDARLRTTQKHIYAAGDVTGKYQFSHAAGYEGGIVIANAVFGLPRKANYTWLPWCTYTDPELASIGMNERAAKEAGVEYSVWEEPFEGNDRALAEGAPEGRIKLLLDKRKKPLGVQIVGPHAGELISEWVAALNGKVGLSTMASSIHPYPTLSELNKRVAGKVVSSQLFSERVRKILRFVYDYKGRACTLD